MKRLALYTCIAAVVAGSGSLWTTGLCACLSATQMAITTSWDGMNEAKLKERVAIPYPRGLPEAELRARMLLSDANFEKFRSPAPSERRIVCTIPHDQNAWRRTFAELTIELDSDRRIESAAIARISRARD